MEFKLSFEPELFFTPNLIPARHLDPEVCSLLVRTESNYADDGFDVLLDVSFGTDRVRLRAKDVVLDVTVRVEKAAIELHPINCDTETKALSGIQQIFSWTTSINDSAASGTSINNKSTVSSDGKVSIQPTFGVKTSESLASGKTISEEVSDGRTFQKLSVKRTGAHRLSLVGPAKYLDGQVLNSARLWTAKPKANSQKFGVLGRVVVRQDWLSFENPKFLSTNQELTRLLKSKLLRSDGASKYFSVLLSHLVSEKLQNNENSKEAVIAFHGIAGHSIENAMQTVERSTEFFDIDHMPILDFAKTQDGHEIAALLASGVDVEVLTNVRKLEKAPRSSSIFIPYTSPIAALEAFKSIIAIGGECAVSEIQDVLVRDKVLTDLKKLGLVSTPRNGYVKLASDHVLEPEDIFKRALSATSTIQLTRTLLLQNPRCTAETICSAIGISLGKSFKKDTTIQRVGNALRRWTLWVEPHLIDPSEDEGLNYLVASAKSRFGGPVRSPLATEENLKKAANIILEGGTFRDAAQAVGCTAGAISSWKRNGWLPGVGLPRKRQKR